MRTEDSGLKGALPLTWQAAALLIDALRGLAPWTAIRVERISDPRPCSLESFRLTLAAGRLTGQVVIVPDLVDWTDSRLVAVMAEAIAAPFLEGGA